MLQLAKPIDAERLASQSNFTMSDRFPDFSISSFEERHAVPRHPVTLPGLPFHMRRVIREITASFETPMP